MSRPYELTAHVDRSQLAVAEPGVDILAVGHWTRCGKISLFVGLRQIPFGYDGVLPELAAVFPVECRNREYWVRRGTVARTRAAERMLTRGCCVGALHERRMNSRPQCVRSNLIRDDHAIVPHNGRRDTETAQRRFPCDVRRAGPFGRKTGLSGNACTRWPPPLWPVLGLSRGEQQRNCIKRDSDLHGLYSATILCMSNSDVPKFPGFRLGGGCKKHDAA